MGFFIAYYIHTLGATKTYNVKTLKNKSFRMASEILIYVSQSTVFIEMIMDYIKENMQTNYKGVTETEGVL